MTVGMVCDSTNIFVIFFFLYVVVYNLGLVRTAFSRIYLEGHVMLEGTNVPMA